MPNKKTAAHIDIDQISSADVAERVAKTREHITAIRELWPGLTRMDEAQRKKSLGRNVGVLATPLRLLFGILQPAKGPAPDLAKHFDALGDQDEGEDPERFETALLARRLDRVEAQQEVLDELEDLGRQFGDDILSTGGEVIGPGLLALELARSLSKVNAGYRTMLAPVLDALRQLTKKARKAQAEKKSSAKSPS